MKGQGRLGQACCGKQGTGVCPKDGHQPGLVGVLNPALRQPEVGGEQEERNVEVHWHFPDQHRSLGSVISGWVVCGPRYTVLAGRSCG